MNNTSQNTFAPNTNRSVAEYLASNWAQQRASTAFSLRNQALDCGISQEQANADFEKAKAENLANFRKDMEAAATLSGEPNPGVARPDDVN